MQGNKRTIRWIRSIFTISAAMVSAFSCIPLAKAQQIRQGPMAQAQSGAEVPGGETGFPAFSAIVPGKVVKGVPYSAVAITEMTQQLTNGNPIKHTMTANVYRDSQGRTRREENLGGRSVVFISDPVSGFDYVLDPEKKTARKMPSISANPMPMAKIFPPRPGNPVGESGGQAVPGVQLSTESQVQPSAESLGQKTIEGVVVEGKRIRTAIPADAMGDQRPISTVTEEWFSPELQVLVLSKTTGPRLSETTCRLTNIRREEPPETLFTLPADYLIKDFNRLPPPPPLPGE